MGGKGRDTISPARRRAWHRLAETANRRVQGQDILFTGFVKYNFPRKLDESELPALRNYIAERTKLTLEYEASTRGVMQPAYEGTPTEVPQFRDHSSIASYTMRAWDGKVDTGKVGIYFMAVGDDNRLESTKFRGIEFTPDPTGALSPSRDENLRHRLYQTFEGYFNKDNVDVTTFGTIGTSHESGTTAALA